jgi:hypothetical protein
MSLPARLGNVPVTQAETLVDTPATRQTRTHCAAAVANTDRDLGFMYDAAKKHLGKDVLFLFSRAMRD